MAKRAQTQQPDFRLDELLMTRSGIVSILKAMEDGSDRWENEFVISDRHFFVRGVANNGRPHGTDSDVLLAMQTLFWQAGCPSSNAIQTTPYALLTLAGLDTSGRSYQRLREALLRFDGLNWSTRVSRKDSSGKFIGQTHTTVLLDELLVSDRSLTPSGDEGELRSTEPIFVRFGHRYAESIREGLHQMLAVQMLAALKQPTALGKRPGLLKRVRSGQDAVAVGLRVGYGGSAYPTLIKATQPCKHPLACSDPLAEFLDLQCSA